MRPASHVVIETSSEAFAVARLAEEAGHKVSVVPSVLAKALGVGSRGVKTDVRDARALSQAACQLSELPRVHVPSQRASEWRSLNTSREALIASRTQLVNRVRGFLRTVLHRSLRCTPKTLPKKVREAKLDRGLPPHIESVLTVIEALSEQIAELDRQLEQLTKEDPTCRLLRTLPGVGPVTASRFVAALDTPERFKNAVSVMAYLGLTAGERSSGLVTRRTGVTKAGPAPVRRALGQAAWCLWRLRPDDPVVRWAQQVAKRRGRQVAIVALARKMAGILYAMWRDNEPYAPERGAQALGDPMI